MCQQVESISHLFLLLIFLGVQSTEWKVVDFWHTVGSMGLVFLYLHSVDLWSIIAKCISLMYHIGFRWCHILGIFRSDIPTSMKFSTDTSSMAMTCRNSSQLVLRSAEAFRNWILCWGVWSGIRDVQNGFLWYLKLLHRWNYGKSTNPGHLPPLRNSRVWWPALLRETNGFHKPWS